MQSNLVLEVMDWDPDSYEAVGSLIFDIKDLLESKQKSFFWDNIYGAPG